MKFKYIFNYLFLFTITIATTSCGKWFDVNQDPNAVLSPPAPQLLTAAQVRLGYVMGSNVNRYALIFAQQYAGQFVGGGQMSDYTGYQLVSSDVNEAFRSHFYAGVLADIDALLKLTEGKSPHYAGIAKILQVYTYQNIVDLWGDVPFSEALLRFENLQPKFDDDEAIYNALMARLDEAITNLNAAVSELTPGSDDIMHSGATAVRLDKWIRTAYTLQLRLALRYTDMVAKIDAIIAKPGARFILSNADNLNGNFSATTGNQNPIHQFQIARSSQIFPGATIVNMMGSKADPRRSAYFTTFNNAFVGSPIDRNTTPSPNYSGFGTFLRGATLSGEAPMRLVTAAEHAFIRAEYLLAKGSLAAAQTFFQSGINLSMSLVGVSNIESTNYVNANGTLSNDVPTALAQIMEQKYIANYGAGIEPWTDWRRTGFPALTPALNAVSPNIPRVLPYPQNEIDTNPKTPARASIFNKAIFWDR